MKRPAYCDRFALVVLATIALLTLAGISAGAILKRVPNDSQTLLGVIVGGLMLFAREIVQTIRAFWQDDRMGKMSDQLANSAPNGAPALDPDAPPQPVNLAQVGGEPEETKP